MVTMDTLVSLCKRRGFLFQSSEIYGGLNGFWDYGPLGVELKRNVKDAWWNDNIKFHNDVRPLPGAPARGRTSLWNLMLSFHQASFTFRFSSTPSGP